MERSLRRTPSRRRLVLSLGRRGEVELPASLVTWDGGKQGFSTFDFETVHTGCPCPHGNFSAWGIMEMQNPRGWTACGHLDRGAVYSPDAPVLRFTMRITRLFRGGKDQPLRRRTCERVTTGAHSLRWWFVEGLEYAIREPRSLHRPGVSVSPALPSSGSRQ